MMDSEAIRSITINQLTDIELLMYNNSDSRLIYNQSNAKRIADLYAIDESNVWMLVHPELKFDRVVAVNIYTKKYKKLPLLSENISDYLQVLEETIESKILMDDCLRFGMKKNTVEKIFREKLAISRCILSAHYSSVLSKEGEVKLTIDQDLIFSTEMRNQFQDKKNITIEKLNYARFLIRITNLINSSSSIDNKNIFISSIEAALEEYEYKFNLI